MQRKRHLPLVTTYGQKDKQKKVRNTNMGRPTGNSPLVSWNKYVNKSDSFDKLFTTAKTKDAPIARNKENTLTSDDSSSANIVEPSTTAKKKPNTCTRKSKNDSFSQFFKSSRDTTFDDGSKGPTLQHLCRPSYRSDLRTLATSMKLPFRKELLQKSSTPCASKVAQPIAGTTLGQALPLMEISPVKCPNKPNFAVSALNKNDMDNSHRRLFQDASDRVDMWLSPVVVISPLRKKKKNKESHFEETKNNYSMTEISLLSLCNQPEILHFEECFPSSLIKKCRKIGEGTYGEVFEIMIKNELIILKVVPIEGNFEVNGAVQKPFKEIETEAIIAKDLSDLKRDGTCSTFIELINTYCIKGEYPELLSNEWQRYHRQFTSENVNPAEVFNADQLFMAFVYKNGGIDLEHYKFTRAAQVRSVFFQLAFALAVAEEKLNFEHRDLHWGNILISKTSATHVHFRLSGKVLDVDSDGVFVQIIDYSLSRMQKDGQQIMYNNLAEDDDLFTGEGDYQFEVYRMMKELNKNNWHTYNPKTNLFWLNYILNKLHTKVKCRFGSRAVQTQVIEQLLFFQSRLLLYNSAMQFVSEEMLPS